MVGISRKRMVFLLRDTSDREPFDYATFIAHSAKCNFINETVWDKLFNSLIMIGFNSLTTKEIEEHVTPYVEEAGGIVLGAVRGAPFPGIKGLYVIVRKVK